MKIYDLVCSVCGKPLTMKEPPYMCPDCNAPAEPVIDVMKDPEHSREVIKNGCSSGCSNEKERFSCLLSVIGNTFQTFKDLKFRQILIQFHQ